MIGLVACAVAALVIAGGALVGELQGDLGADRAARLLGREVIARNGDVLGTVGDTVSDRNGHVAYIVIDRAQSRGPDDTLMPVPAAAVRTFADTLMVDAERNSSKTPLVAARGWPDFQDPGYDRELDRYYGIVR